MQAVSAQGSMHWVLMRRFEFLMQTLDGVGRPDGFPLVVREAQEGEELLASLFQAGSDWGAAQAPFAQECLALGVHLLGRLGVDHVGVVGTDLVVPPRETVRAIC